MIAAEVTFTEARAGLADLVGRVSYGGERVVLTRHGRRAAALVPIADLERLEAMDSPDGHVVPLRQGSFDHGSPTSTGQHRLDAAARHDNGPNLDR